MSTAKPTNRVVTSADVAELAGVSRATVSLVLNGRLDKIRISEKTKERVVEVAAELGYTPNHAARSLRRRRTNIIAYVLSTLDNPYSAEIVTAAQSAAEAAGYALSIMPAPTPELVARALSQLHAGVADAALLSIPSDLMVKELKQLVRRGMPTVLMQHRSPDPAIPAVLVDLEAGGHMATRHLIGLGHRRIAHIGDRRQYLQRRRDRTDGYRRALVEGGIEQDAGLLIEAENSLAGGFAAMQSLLALPVPPTAVFAFNDQMAIGALRAAAAAGLKVPGDLAIVGFDGVSLGEFLTPQLSSIEHSRREVGRAAVRTVVAMLAGGEPPMREQVLPVELVVRESCGGRRTPPGERTHERGFGN